MKRSTRQSKRRRMQSHWPKTWLNSFTSMSQSTSSDRSSRHLRMCWLTRTSFGDLIGSTTSRCLCWRLCWCTRVKCRSQKTWRRSRKWSRSIVWQQRNYSSRMQSKTTGCSWGRSRSFKTPWSASWRLRVTTACERSIVMPLSSDAIKSLSWMIQPLQTRWASRSRTRMVMLQIKPHLKSLQSKRLNVRSYYKRACKQRLSMLSCEG